MEWIQQYLTDDFTTMTIRIFIAALLSGIIGIEREWKNHPAGFRTHVLVGVGSCLMMLLSLFGFSDYVANHPHVQFDPARIPSYVISGIGFLGAGTILVRGATVKGLTTAATIWVVAGIGLIIGVGMYAPGILTTGVVFLSLLFLNKFEALFKKKIEQDYLMIDTEAEITLKEIVAIFERHNVTILKVEVKLYRLKSKVRYSFTIAHLNRELTHELYQNLLANSRVQRVRSGFVK